MFSLDHNIYICLKNNFFMINAYRIVYLPQSAYFFTIYTIKDIISPIKEYPVKRM